MKKNVYVADVQRITVGLQTLGIPVAPQASPDYSCPISCHLYRNPDGSIRWLWPANARQPDFLRFYHNGNRRAQLFSWLVNRAFRLGMGRWMAQDTLTLYTTEGGYQRMRQAQLTRWALFTGTAGPNRKLVLWYRTQTGSSSFVKIALTSDARKNLRQEALALYRLQRQPFLQLTTPSLNAYAPGVLVQEDLGAPETRQTNRLADLPAGGLLELVSRNGHAAPLGQTDFWIQARQALRELRRTPDARLPISLLDKVERLMNGLSEQQVVPLAAAHGDFTPWNIQLRNDALCVIDWELHHAALPTLYDFFHFQYQGQTLIGNRGYGAVRKTVDETLRQPEWHLFRERQGLDTELAEKLYLIHTVTYYLAVYSRQERWHRQVDWLLTTWNDALTHWLHQQNALPDRNLVLHDLAIWLHQRPYAALKFLPTQLDALPDASDLDLCMPQSVARQLTRFLRQHPCAAQVVVDHRSFMKQIHIRCRDNTMLHLDLIWSFKRKQLEFMPAETGWNQATMASHGLKVPPAEINQTYIRLFYGLNDAPVPERYQGLYGAQKPTPTLAELRAEVGQMPQNRGWRGARNTIAYAWDTVRSFTYRRGMIVTFSGVDGAGKSTIIDQTKLAIEKRLRQRVVVLRHRPSLLPILSAWKYGKKEAEQRSAERLPRQGTNTNGLSSLLRFGYYFTDYLLGQFYVQVKYVWRGYIVLYDRYYFDFINDSRRSNVALPAGLASSLYRLLLKPRLNVFLYAPPAVILRRKQELDAATITSLTTQYLQLFEQLQERYPASDYMPVLNQDLVQTLNRIFNRIQHFTN